ADPPGGERPGGQRPGGGPGGGPGGDEGPGGQRRSESVPPPSPTLPPPSSAAALAALAAGGAPESPRQRLRLLRRLRLRHRLGLALVITALLPVLVASWVAVSVVLRSLNSGLHAETERQLHVGLNLLLRNVERIGQEATRLSGARELVAAVGEEPDAEV